MTPHPVLMPTVQDRYWVVRTSSEKSHKNDGRVEKHGSWKCSRYSRYLRTETFSSQLKMHNNVKNKLDLEVSQSDKQTQELETKSGPSIQLYGVYFIWAGWFITGTLFQFCDKSHHEKLNASQDFPLKGVSYSKLTSEKHVACVIQGFRLTVLGAWKSTTLWLCLFIRQKY